MHVPWINKNGIASNQTYCCWK